MSEDSQLETMESLMEVARERLGACADTYGPASKAQVFLTDVQPGQIYLGR